MTNMTGLPMWEAEEKKDDDSFYILCISFGILFVLLILPTILLLVLGGYKRSDRKCKKEKSQVEDLSHLDHIFDPDGRYRETKFEGMLNEDAADDVEIPSKTEKDDSAKKEKGKKPAHYTAPKMKNVGTQTEPSLFKSSESIPMMENRWNILRPVYRTVEDDHKLTPRRRYSLKQTQRETQRQRERGGKLSDEHKKLSDEHKKLSYEHKKLSDEHKKWSAEHKKLSDERRRSVEKLLHRRMRQTRTRTAEEIDTKDHDGKLSSHERWKLLGKHHHRRRPKKTAEEIEKHKKKTFSEEHTARMTAEEHEMLAKKKEEGKRNTVSKPPPREMSVDGTPEDITGGHDPNKDPKKAKEK